MQISDTDAANKVGQTRGSVTAMYLSEMLRWKREITKCYIATDMETAGASSKALQLSMDLAMLKGITENTTQISEQDRKTQCIPVD